jgi:ATP-dependent RNA helicase DeaD
LAKKRATRTKGSSAEESSSEKSSSRKSRDEKSNSSKSSSGKPTSAKSKSDKPKSDKPKSKSKSEKPKTGFDLLPLKEELFSGLRKAGYAEPTPVQAGLIPRALDSGDVVGQARTGTGKTAAFAIPILQKLEERGGKRSPRALVLVPTRELAVQVRDECAKLAVDMRHKAIAIYGGKPIRPQVESLRQGVDIVVGTPGRVIDHIGRATMHTDALEVVVLDEADRMLDIGFRPDIERILKVCPKERQTLLLSATLPPPIQRLAKRYMNEPEMLDYSTDNLSHETIEQFYFTVDETKKYALLLRLLARERPQQAIIFCRTKRRVDSVTKRLLKTTKFAGCLHGDMDQRARDRAMENFRSGRLRFLVATDIAGRGIDVSGISHIINYDIPEFSDDYVHRVGRTGRMGREGVAFSFVRPEQGGELTRIEQRINRILIRDDIPGFQPFIESAPRPAANEESDAAAPPPPPNSRRKRYRKGL